MNHASANFIRTRPVPGLALILCVLVFSLISSSVWAEVYKWTDENGVTHYSQTPPPSGQEAEIEDIPDSTNDAGLGEPDDAMASESGSDPGQLSAADLARQELASRREYRAEEYAANQALCQEARESLDELEPSRRVYYTNEEGETERMDDQERVDEVQRLKNVLSANCE